MWRKIFGETFLKMLIVGLKFEFDTEIFNELTWYAMKFQFCNFIEFN